MTHIWGVSKAADRVMAQVAGLAPEKAKRRVMVPLQAYLDESESDGVFALGGYMGTAESWTNFSRIWEGLLRHHGTIDDDGSYHFKMSDMGGSPERMKRVPVFWDVIEEHVLGWVSVWVRTSLMENAMNRIVMEDQFGVPLPVDWGPLANHYLIAFHGLLDEFQRHRTDVAEVIPPDAKFDFYFDKRTEAKFIHAAWANHLAILPKERRDLYGSHPRFEDDKEYLPLQAADFWAWWVRKWVIEGAPEKVGRCAFSDFGRRRKKRFAMMEGEITENDIVRSLLAEARSQRPDLVIYDLKEGRNA
jgi:hypothetical protein